MTSVVGPTLAEFLQTARKLPQCRKFFNLKVNAFASVGFRIRQFVCLCLKEKKGNIDFISHNVDIYTGTHNP